MAKLNSTLGTTILEFVQKHAHSSSNDIHRGVGGDFSYATVKRAITALISEGHLAVYGQGKNTRYALSPAYELLLTIEPDQYFKQEIDERAIKASFNAKLISDTLSVVSIFSEKEQQYLSQLQFQFEQNLQSLSPETYHKEFERLAIDLSWKSSQIEGNTYSLLETERLLKEHEVATGKSREEATMLLNHKAALDFILKHPDYVHPLSIASIEDIHSILIQDLNVERNIRQRRVGISGTNYRPLDNEFQIKEAMGDMCALVNQRANVFEKALLALVLISYIQPFADGNKRTARIVSNALLIQHRHCPISFRTVDSLDYKKAMLIFYEQNNISAFKKIFMDQFAFAVKTYF